MALIAAKASKDKKLPFLTKEILQDLKCIDCGGYLSTPPILKHPTKGSLCGHCSFYNMKEEFVRNTEYETIASLLEFPCNNETCHKRLLFGKIGEHELVCNFRQYECPVDEICKWVGPSFEIRTHFSSRHPTNFIETNFFTLDLRKDCINTMLLNNDAEIFLVQYQCIVKTCKFWCLVRYVGQPGKSNLYRFTLEISGNKSDKVYKTTETSVRNDICFLMDRHIALEVNISEMLRFLNCPGKVNCLVNVRKLNV